VLFIPAPIRVSAQPIARLASARGNSRLFRISELTLLHLGICTLNRVSLNHRAETGQPVCFHTLPHSFALMEVVTYLFSTASALLYQDMGGGGGAPTPRGEVPGSQAPARGAAVRSSSFAGRYAGGSLIPFFRFCYNPRLEPCDA
jgi:hypothetical protein